MYAITGITGQVGSIVAQTLLASGKNIRAVVRNAEKGEYWARQGCEVALADINDATALQHAFCDTEGVFVLLPPNFAPSPGFPEVRQSVAALRLALAIAKPPKVVCLSTIGAQAQQPNLLQQLQVMEQELSTLPLPIRFLRAAWFIENAVWDVEPARTSGLIPSFLQPLDKPVPMVATADVGRFAAGLLEQTWEGIRIDELEGPQRITPNDIAACFSRLLDREIRMQPVPRTSWESLFKSQGMADPTPRIQMLDGFNQGWIEFEGGAAGSHKGQVSLETVLQQLLAR